MPTVSPPFAARISIAPSPPLPEKDKRALMTKTAGPQDH
jgi:hypothetical protein